MVTTGMKREDKKRPEIIPLHQRLFQRTEENFWRIQYTNVF